MLFLFVPVPGNPSLIPAMNNVKLELVLSILE